MTVFECQLCGECCYGEGGIPVAEGEAARIAGFLGRPADRFLDLFCETRNGRLYLRTGPDKTLSPAMLYRVLSKRSIKPVNTCPGLVEVR